jgi:hypothetical protein
MSAVDQKSTPIEQLDSVSVDTASNSLGVRCSIEWSAM